jgi:TonB family protein
MSDYKNDIEKYRKGDLTATEMHKLEKRALNDPFLSDALEGAESISSQDFSKDLSEINTTLLPKENKTPWFIPVRIAAGVILIVGSVVLLYRTSEPEQQLALQKEEVQPLSSVDSIVKNDEPRLLSLSQPKEELTERLAEPKPELAPLVAKTDVSVETKPAAGLSASSQTSNMATIEPIKADQVLTAELSELALEEEKIEAKDKIAAAPVQQASKKETRDEDLVIRSKTKKSADTKLLTQKRTVKGLVTSSGNGLPLPGVRVSVEGTTTETVTDLQGNYSIPIENEKQQLSFSFNGLPTSQFSLTDRSTLDTKLPEEGSQQSEVVVTGQCLKSVWNETLTPVLKLAEPVGGRIAYKKHLENNQRYPRQALENNVKGDVIINFVLAIDGSFRDFSVIGSLGYGCDDEVIRLVKQGPKWYPSTENNVPIESNVTVRLKFDPEKVKK